MKETIKIALADSNTLMRTALVKYLSDTYYLEVLADADNGKHLIEQLSKTKTLPHICIIDINMPELNGLNTLKAIREQFQQVNVLVLTQYDNELSLLKFLRNGAKGYITKNSRPQDFYSAITQIYHGGIYYPDFMLKKISGFLKHPEVLNNIVDFTSREYEFLSLCTTELTYQQIADKMNISFKSVNMYRATLFNKLKVCSRVGLAVYAYTTGINHIIE